MRPLRSCSLALGLAAGVFMTTPAMAQQCATSQRMSMNNPVTANLSRQIAAIRASMERRQCTGREQGFFSPCRDLASRLSNAIAQFRQSSRMMHESRCLPADKEPLPQRRTRRQERPVTIGNRLETMCVRLSDGYFFPTPNSGYGRAKDEPQMRAQCALICNTPDVEVFGVSGSERSADGLFSLTTGKPYSSLKNAGSYRIAQRLNRCDMARYVSAALKTTSDATPVETKSTKDSSRVRMTLSQLTLLGDMDLRLTPIDISDDVSVAVETKARKVRIVGTPFLPPAEEKMP